MNDGRSRRLPWVVAAALLVGSLLGGVGAILSGSSTVRHEPVAIKLDLPPELARPSSRRGKGPEAAGLPVAGGPPLLLDAALFELTPAGFLPRIATDGRRPWEAFRRRSAPAPKPRVAILLLEIGLDEKASAEAASLPLPVTLVVSPYAKPEDGWFRAARWSGKETLLELPIRPDRFPLEDAGPLALDPDVRPASRLNDVLSRGIGYLGVATRAGPFGARADAFHPVAESLAGRGLALVEIGAEALEAVAGRLGLPYRATTTAIDEDPSSEAIDAVLATLETRASAEGFAVGYGRPLPVTLDRLARWSRTLSSRGIALIGIGELLRSAAAEKGSTP